MVFTPQSPDNPLTKSAYDYAFRILERERVLFSKFFIESEAGFGKYVRYRSCPELSVAPLEEPPIPTGLMHCFNELVELIVPKNSRPIPLKQLKQVRVLLRSLNFDLIYG